MNTQAAINLCRSANVELFQVTRDDARRNRADGSEPRYAGFYYWTCFPGCLPDSDAFGPFRSWRAAALDAVDTFDLEGVTP